VLREDSGADLVEEGLSLVDGRSSRKRLTKEFVK
jgi:hypothetical protein